MAQIRTFKDLIVWQKSHNLALHVYEITKFFPAEEKFGLVSQMRRAVVSLACNIVEGFRRKTVKDSLNFYNIAQGSLEELKYQLMLSFDLKLLDQKEYNQIAQETEETSKILYGWINSNKQKLK
ncbi:MAG: four helix bundle protein [Patescibacteria group bacterium]|jgi:four helix bundle protein